MKEAQIAVKRFLEDSQLRCPAEHRLLDIASELGEVSKEVLVATQYGAAPFAASDALHEETGDLLFSLLAFCEEAGIDAQKALNGALEKYRARLEQRGTAGSI